MIYYAILDEREQQRKKVRLMKYYADYTGVGEWSLLTEKQWQAAFLDEDNRADDSKLRALEGMNGYNTLKEAKDYILGGVKCDLNDLYICKYDVKKWKVK